VFKEIKLNKEQLFAIEKETLDKFPNEMCGFIIQNSFIPVENIAETPETSFKLDKKDIIKYLPTAKAIIHSHCRKSNYNNLFDIRTPSYADRVKQQTTNLPWLIVGSEGLTVTDILQFPRIPNKQYLNRRFIWTINDCYTLVQDYFRFEFDITLKDAVYPEDLTNLHSSHNLFEPFIEEYGFKEIEFNNLINGDLVILNYVGLDGNHLGIYHNGNIIHQDSISKEEPLEYYLSNINKVLRYVG